MSLKEYLKLFSLFPNHVDGIVTSKDLSEITLNGKLTLKDCASCIDDVRLRTAAYRHFSKYPIDNWISDDRLEELLTKSYKIKIGNSDLDAFHPYIALINTGFLFTLGVHEDLRRNYLEINSEGETSDVLNLYGLDSNTAFIESVVKKSLLQHQTNKDKLLTILGENSVSQRFNKGFEGLTIAIQEAVIKGFEKARERKGATPFFADGFLIKDVTPEKSRHHVFELRIFDPAPFRVYFYETASKIFLALVDKKPQKKSQTNDINAAASIIAQLVRLEG